MINPLYSVEDNFKEVKVILKKSFKSLLVWFYENHMVLNPIKSHNLLIDTSPINLFNLVRRFYMLKLSRNSLL